MMTPFDASSQPSLIFLFPSIFVRSVKHAPASLLIALSFATLAPTPPSLADAPVIEVPGSLPTILAPIPDQTLTWEGAAIDLSAHLGLPAVTGPIYQIDTTLGIFNVEMLPASAPITVTNFGNYVNLRVWDNMLVHRSVRNFVIQSGGYSATLPPVALTNYGAIPNEFGVSNTRGTLAMAKQAGNPNSATNQWFVNLANNSGGSASLDTQNGGFTVFARVIGTGMDVVDAIAALPTFNAGGNYTQLPLRNYGTDQQFVETRNLVVINTIRPATELPDGSGKPTVIRFEVINPAPARALAVIEDSTLRVSRVKGDVTLRVQATDTHGNQTETEVRVSVPKFDAAVAEDFSTDLTTLNWGAPALRVVGLPPSVIFDPNTQSLAGSPLGGGTFNPRALLDLGNGARRWEYFHIRTEALPGWLGGQFDLVASRHAAVGNGLGGAATLRVTPNGIASGRLTFAGSALPFRAPVRKISPTEGRLTINFDANARLIDPLALEITLNDDGSATGRLVATAGEVSLNGWKRTWHPVSNPLLGERLGRVNLLADLTSSSWADGLASVPQGTGWIMMTTNRAGVATLRAKLPDGSPVTAATVLGPAGEFALWRPLYGNGGSLDVIGAIDELGVATGTGEWTRPANANPNHPFYPAGFGNGIEGPVPLTLQGGRWIPPTAGNLILGLPHNSSAPEANAEISWASGGIEDSATLTDPLPLIINPAHRATVPVGIDNPARVTVLSLNRITGLAVVRLLLEDDHPLRPGIPLRRPVVQQILLAPHLDGDRLGGGCFLLRQLPAPTTILSGKATLSAVTPPASS